MRVHNRQNAGIATATARQPSATPTKTLFANPPRTIQPPRLGANLKSSDLPTLCLNLQNSNSPSPKPTPDIPHRTKAERCRAPVTAPPRPSPVSRRTPSSFRLDGTRRLLLPRVQQSVPQHPSVVSHPSRPSPRQPRTASPGRKTRQARPPTEDKQRNARRRSRTARVPQAAPRKPRHGNTPYPRCVKLNSRSFAVRPCQRCRTGNSSSASMGSPQ